MRVSLSQKGQSVSAQKVAVLVLNWNGWRDTLACLRAVSVSRGVPFELIVIDNGSTDGSVLHIAEAYPNVRIIATGQNLGFGAGNNVGLRWAIEHGADYAWVLNNDTVVEPDALRELVATAERDETIGMVGSVLRHVGPDPRIQAWGGGRVSFWTGRATNLRRPGRPDYITGASMLLRIRAIEQTGLFDEGYFMYWEDADLSLRMKRAGWRIAVADRSRLVHKESVTAANDKALQARQFSESTVRFFRNHARVPVTPIVIGLGLRVAKYLASCRLDTVGAIFSGATRAFRKQRAPVDCGFDQAGRTDSRT